MIINKCHGTKKPIEYSWRIIRNFKNIEYTKQKIINIHKLTPRHFSNAEKQAKQIRYCIIQAEEYFESSKYVTSVTKPVLIYYFIMCLALVEILIKQSGGSSLDKARDQNRHHGLSFSMLGKLGSGLNLSESSSLLRARPVMFDRKWGGTFGLWHSSSRETPIIGRQTVIKDTYRNNSYEILLGSRDVSLSQPSENGFTLFDLIKMTPFMGELLNDNGIISELARVHVTRDVLERQNKIKTIINFQPTWHSNIHNEIASKIIVKDLNADLFEFNETERGLIWKYTEDIDGPHYNYFEIPLAFTNNCKECFICLNNTTLNEFGLYYYIAFIFGNLARYYPDYWTEEVEKSSPLSQLCYEILPIIGERAPILIASELTQSLIVQYNDLHL